MPSAGSGLFLDLDGTLADSIGVMHTVYAQFLELFDKRASVEEFNALNGPPLEQVVMSLARTHQLSPPIDELMVTYRNLIDASYVDVVPKPYAIELVKTAKRVGMKSGVVTSNSFDLAQAWLQRVGLIELVDVLVGGDEVQRGKPDPEPYNLALERAHCSPEVSLAVEDSSSGAQSSLAAGLRTFMLVGPDQESPSDAVPVKGLNVVQSFILEKLK